MSVDIELVVVTRTRAFSRRRERQVVRSLGDPANVFVGLLDRVTHRGRTPTLDRLDRNGSLELGSDEMPLLLAELGFVRAHSDDLRELAFLAKLSGLARECAMSTKSLLHFEGVNIPQAKRGRRADVDGVVP
jgi:hypothetical protein